MTCPSHNDELLLLAFRYVSGELSAPETEAFEARLAVDAAAQQALVEAVQLSEAIAIGAAERATVRREERVRTRTGRRQVVAAAIAGAVIAGCLFALTGIFDQDNATDQTVATKSSGVSVQEAHSMVSLWSALQIDESDGQIANESYWPQDDDTAGENDEDVPDWMLAAVAGADGGEWLDPEGLPQPMDSLDDADEETL